MPQCALTKCLAHFQAQCVYSPYSPDRCYILNLPLLFLIHPHPFTHLPTKPPIPRTALLSSLTSLILFLLIPLIFSLALPLNPFASLPYYVLGHIPLTASLSSAPTILMETPQSFGSWPGPTRPTFVPWNILPSFTNVSALLTTLMVVTNELSSYLPILSFISMDLLLIPSYCFLHVSAIFSLLLFPDFLLLPCVSAHLLWACYCSWFSTRLHLPLYIRPPCWAVRP
jgi:hypothetical protein